MVGGKLMAGIIQIKEIVSRANNNVFQQLRANIESETVSQKKKWISSTHINIATLDFLDKYISSKVNQIVIEFPYSDKEYLSTVYAYYIKATKPAIKECYRLHFYIDDEYMGYIVLRPTPYSHIGRIQMSPIAFLKDKAWVATCSILSNVVGSEQGIENFSFTKQDPEIAMCAQVTIWSVLEYFFNIGLSGNRMKVADVTNNTLTFLEKKIPAKGLTANHIMEVLNNAGLYPILKSSIDFASINTDGEIFSYLESGIPVIGLNSAENHAVCLIGHTEFQHIDVKSLDAYVVNLYDDSNELSDPNFKIIIADKLVSNYVVNDDNFAPYQFLARKCTLTSTGYLPYTATKLDTFIVPLSEKMYITYENVYQFVMDYLSDSRYQNSFPNTSVVRIFLTLSNKFKSSVYDKIYDNDFFSLICHLNMSTYIWCVEVSSVSSFNQGKVECLFIFDSTRHSNDRQPWLLIKDLKSVSFYDGESFSSFDLNENISMDRYNGNLEEYVP